MYLIFYIPGYYTFYTRHHKLKDVFRLMLTYFVPIVLFLCWRNYSVCFLLLAFLLVYDLYEIGYIENDCETINKEKNPTLRVSQQDLFYYNKHKYLIYTLKLIVAAILSVALFYNGCKFEYIFIPYILIPLYFIYNRIRCKWNLLLHVILMQIRYYIPILIATQVFAIKDFVAFLFIYPIRVAIELSVKGKFGGYYNQFVQNYILHDYSHFQVYRLKYYIVMFLLAGALYGMGVVDFPVLIVYSYFLIFTLISKELSK